MLPTIHATLTDGMQSITAEAKIRHAGWGARRRTISLSAAVGQIHSDLKQWGARPSGCSYFRLLPKFQSVRNERDSIIASVILSSVAAQNHAGSHACPLGALTHNVWCGWLISCFGLHYGASDQDFCRNSAARGHVARERCQDQKAKTSRSSKIQSVGGDLTEEKRHASPITRVVEFWQ
jgi:hypothetical protein